MYVCSILAKASHAQRLWMYACIHVWMYVSMLTHDTHATCANTRVCIYIHTHKYTYAHTRNCVCIYIYIHTHKHTHAYIMEFYLVAGLSNARHLTACAAATCSRKPLCMMYVCMYVCMYVLMYVSMQPPAPLGLSEQCVYVCVYVCMYVLMYVCMQPPAPVDLSA